MSARESRLLHSFPRVLRLPAACSLVFGLACLAPPPASAQEVPPPEAGTTARAVPAPGTGTSDQRQHCLADTSADPTQVRPGGTGTCVLGRAWSRDGAGFWASPGRVGNLALRDPQVQAPAAPAAQSAPRRPTDRIETWGEFDPGDGFLIGRSDAGELSISAYALLRYVNQTPGTQTFTDHFGNEHPVDGRQDIFPHRVIVFLKGWLGTPKLIYTLLFWTVNTTDQDALFAVMGCQFTRRFSWYGGINGSPGTRSLQGSHPFWLGHDRVMADEFFRPYFAFGTWAQGEVAPGLWYNAFAGNNSSSLGVKAVQLDRSFSTGASMWWMPTTHEFGPRGAYGDWEWHEQAATRFGFSSTRSREERFTDATTGATGNTTIKLADGLNVFDTGSLAPGVTIDQVNYRILSVDAGLKYRGFFVQTEVYARLLDDFVADGALPVGSVADKGFYVQAAFFPWKKKVEVYGATSQIYGDKGAGFDNSSEYLAGVNVYPADTRNHRLNFQVIDVNRSPVGSTFGYYTAGQTGTTYSLAFSVFF